METLCYCFGHTLGEVREEIARTGRCTLPERVAAEIRRGRCACETLNPSGRCCLASLREAVRRELDRNRVAIASGPIHDCRSDEKKVVTFSIPGGFS